MIHNHEVTSSILVLATQKSTYSIVSAFFCRGFSFFCCLQSQAPQDREAFSLSRGFPYLMVPATAFWHTWNLSAPFFMVKL